MQRYLSSLLEPYEDPENSNVTVGFNKEVTLENGIYFNDSFQDEADVEQQLSGVQRRKRSTQWAQATRCGASPRKTT